MRIVLSASGDDLDASIDPRFGRCSYFMIVDPETMGFEVFNNENVALGGGAGIQAAQFVASKGADLVITGNCGPNAMKTLAAAGVQVIVGQSGTIRQAVERYRQGLLSHTTQANVEDHHGMRGGQPGGLGGGGGGGGRGCRRAAPGGAPTSGYAAAPAGAGAAAGDIRDDLRSLGEELKALRRQIENLEARMPGHGKD